MLLVSSIGSTTVESRVRAGARVLSIFNNPLNTLVLRAHAQGAKRHRHLQETARSYAEATIRDAVNNLCELGALERREVREARKGAATSLTPAGEEILAVADALERWLDCCPTGPIELVDGTAGVAVKALAEGWNSTLLRELAIAPRTITEMSGLIPGVSYPAVERRVRWMRSVGQIAPLPKESRGVPYVAEDWLRFGVGPLVLASRCEARYMEGAPPFTDTELETLFLLALPLVNLAPTLYGGCVLAGVESSVGAEESVDVAGVEVEVSEGVVIHVAPADLEADPSSWALGTPEAWLDAAVEGGLGDLRIGGRSPRLARTLSRGIHSSLFPNR